MLPGTDEKEAMEVAERLRKAIESSSINANDKIKYTVSIGAVTITPDKEINIETLLKSSNKALYLAKTQGKNCVVWLPK